MPRGIAARRCCCRRQAVAGRSGLRGRRPARATCPDEHPP
jgi:hypothetical protein